MSPLPDTPLARLASARSTPAEELDALLRGWGNGPRSFPFDGAGVTAADHAAAATDQCAHAVIFFRMAHRTPVANPALLDTAFDHALEALSQWDAAGPGVADPSRGLNRLTVRSVALMTSAELLARAKQTQNAVGVGLWSDRLQQHLEAGLVEATDGGAFADEWYALSADVARLLAHVRHWGLALRVARRVVEAAGKDHAATAALLGEPWLQIFLGSDADGNRRILSPKEIAAKARREIAWWQRLKGVLRHPAYTPTRDSVTDLACGLAAGWGSEHLCDRSPSVVVGALSAIAGIEIGRAIRTWVGQQPEDILALHATPPPPPPLLGRFLGEGLACGAAAMMLQALPAALPVMADAIGYAWGAYGDLVRWPVAHAPDLVDGTALRHLSEWGWDLVHADPLDLVRRGLQYPMEAAALVVFGASLNSRTRAWAERHAFYGLPGSIYVAADLGSLILGHDGKYFSHMAQAMVAVAAGAGILFAGGLTGGSAKETGVAPTWRDRVVGGLSHVAEHSRYLWAAAIFTGIFKPLGGMMQNGVHPDSFALAVWQGAAITFMTAPPIIILSGLIKGCIPGPELVRSAWRDRHGWGPVRAVQSLVAGSAAAVGRPYAKGRFWRSFMGPEWPGAGLAALADWDSVWGEVMRQGYFGFSVNARAASAFVDTEGTLVAREGLKAALQGSRFDPRDKRNWLTKPGHLLYPFALRDRLWVFWAVTRTWRLPKFPHVPNAVFHATLHQMLTDPLVKPRLDSDELKALLRRLRIAAADPAQYGIVRPFLRTLAMASRSPAHGKVIRELFAERPDWVVMFDLQDDLDHPVLLPEDGDGPAPAGAVRCDTREAAFREVGRRHGVSADAYTAMVLAHRYADALVTAGRLLRPEERAGLVDPPPPATSPLATSNG